MCLQLSIFLCLSITTVSVTNLDVYMQLDIIFPGLALIWFDRVLKYMFFITRSKPGWAL